MILYNQKSFYLMIGNINYNIPLSAINLALAFLQSILYWKYSIK